MKQVIFGISCVSLALSAIWAYKTDWDWEPLICMGGSVIGVISTMDFGVRAEQLVGTWKTVFESPLLYLENVTLFGENGRFASVSKLHIIQFMRFKSKIHLSISGFYNVKENKIYYTYENVDVIYHDSMPYEQIQLILTKVHEQKPEEIISFEESKMVTKGGSESTMVSIRVSKNIDIEYFEKYAEEK